MWRELVERIYPCLLKAVAINLNSSYLCNHDQKINLFFCKINFIASLLFKVSTSIINIFMTFFPLPLPLTLIR